MQTLDFHICDTNPLLRGTVLIVRLKSTQIFRENLTGFNSEQPSITSV
jgi:hypothetical protein